MDLNNVVDSNEDTDTGGAGDENSLSQVNKTMASLGLNVEAAPFIPGQNPYAREFVPSCPSLDLENSNTPTDSAESQLISTQEPGGREETPNRDKSDEEEPPDDWADKADENGTPDEGGGTPPSDLDNELNNGESLTVVQKPKKKKQIEEKKRIRDHLNIVFIGHVDAGKSTIGGHIMYLTGQVEKRTLEKYEREAKEKNRESWYLSWALDTNQEERDKGKTVEVGRAFFETDNKHFTILDAPGHKSFVPNMIGGASQADLAVLVISARRGEFETGFERGGQTREHAMLVKTAGVKHLVVVVNKMDDPTVEWEEKRYIEIKEKLTPYLKKCGFNPKTDVFYIPVSGLTGANLKVADPDVCPWYKGTSLIDYLNELAPMNRMADGAVRLPIVDRYKDMGTIVLGKVESGQIAKGQILTMMPNKVQVEVLQLWSDDEDADSVGPGENVKLKVKNIEEEEVSPGFVLCSPDNLCHTARVFDAQIVILEHKSIICAGYSAVMHIHCCAEEASIKALICLVDRKTAEKSATRPRYIKQDQIAIVRLEIVGGAICVEAFKEFPQMGRFTLRDEGKTIAIGKVLKVIG